MKKYTSQKGFSTIELLIAFAVAIIFLSGTMLLAFGGQTAGLDTTVTNEGLYRTTTRIGDDVRSTINNWFFTPSDDTSGLIKFKSSASEISPCRKNLIDHSDWDTTHTSRERLKMDFGTALVNMDEAVRQGPGGCDPAQTSEWLKPEKDNLSETNVSGADDGTGVEVRTINNTRYAFITANPQGNGVSKKEFVVVDVSDPTHKIEPSDVKARLDADKGLLGLAIAGHYAYVLRNDTFNQLAIIDIQSPENPSKLPTFFDLPSITCAYHVQNCQRKARSIAFYGGYLYIGTGRMSGFSPEFHIYCVSDSSVVGCSPTTPLHVGQLDLEHNINDITIRDNDAFLATSADYGELTVVDVSNKYAPAKPPSYTDPSMNNRKYNALLTTGGASDEDGWSIAVLGHYAYLGRERTQNNVTNRRELYVLDISNLSNIRVTTGVTQGALNTGMAKDSRISGIEVTSNTAFIITTDPNRSLFIVDVEDKGNPHVRNTCGGVNTSQAALALEFKDNLIFIAHAQGSSLLKIIYDKGYACAP